MFFVNKVFMNRISVTANVNSILETPNYGYG